jgi:hypothetical protein
MRLGHRSTQLGLVSTIATLAIASVACAQERAGVVTTLEGKVTVARASSSELSPLKFRDAVFVRDRIATGKDSFARVLLGGRAVVTIREFSAVTITEVPGVATVDVGSGRVAVAVARERMRPGDLVEVRTPNAVAGIRGTVIVAEVFNAQRSVITVLKGVIDVTRLDAGRASGPATMLNALQQVTITGVNPVSAPQPITADTAQRIGAEFRAAPPRPAQNATTAAVSQGEIERVARDMGGVVAEPAAVATADSSSGKVKSVQSDQPSGDSDKGKSGQPGTATVSTSGSSAIGSATSSASDGASTTAAAGGGAASSASTPAASAPASAPSTAAAASPATASSAPAAPSAPAAVAAVSPTSAPAVSTPAVSAAPAASAPASAPVASVPMALSAPVAGTPIASTAPVSTAPVASPPVVSVAPATSGPAISAPPVASAPVATPSVTPAVSAPVVTPTAAPTFMPTGLAKELTGLGNAWGNLKDVKVDRDNKGKNR